jgi:hypothetical protein
MWQGKRWTSSERATLVQRGLWVESLSVSLERSREASLTQGESRAVRWPPLSPPAAISRSRRHNKICRKHEGRGETEGRARRLTDSSRPKRPLWMRLSLLSHRTSPTSVAKALEEAEVVAGLSSELARWRWRKELLLTHWRHLRDLSISLPQQRVPCGRDSLSEGCHCLHIPGVATVL